MSKIKAMKYLRDKIKLGKSSNVFTVRLDDESMQKIDLLSEYLNIRKGELIKLGLSYIDPQTIKHELIKDSEHKMQEKCKNGIFDDFHIVKSEIKL